jgi:hypothetical protein
MNNLSTISWLEWVLFQWDVDDDDVCFVPKKTCWISKFSMHNTFLENSLSGDAQNQHIWKPNTQCNKIRDVLQ